MAQLTPPPQHPRDCSDSEDSGGVAPKLPFHHGLGMARPKSGPTPVPAARRAPPEPAAACRACSSRSLRRDYTGWAAAHAEAIRAGLKLEAIRAGSQMLEKCHTSEPTDACHV